MEGTVSGLSLARYDAKDPSPFFLVFTPLSRKCLILFNWLSPLTTITARQSLPYATASKFGDAEGKKKHLPKQPLLYQFLHAPPPVLLDLLNSFADDIATFSRLGLIGKRVGEQAGRLADWCWFSATLVGLIEVGVDQGVVKTMIEEGELGRRVFFLLFFLQGPACS